MNSSEAADGRPAKVKDELSIADEAAGAEGENTTISDNRTSPEACLASRPPDAAEAWIGKTLNGRFEILSAIGEGGMSCVYRAKDIVLRKVVAIKVLRQHLL